MKFKRVDHGHYKTTISSVEYGIVRDDNNPKIWELYKIGFMGPEWLDNFATKKEAVQFLKNKEREMNEVGESHEK